MASTPSNRLKLTPSNSPFINRMSRSPIRSRTFNDLAAATSASASSNTSAPSRLSLKRVVGSTCSSPTGFDTVNSCFAYIAGGAVVVVDVYGDYYRQRFYRARPTAVPVFSVSPINNGPSTPNSTPKANDSRSRLTLGSSHRDSAFGLPDWAESPTSGKTWTQRERIKSATCLSLSRDGRFLAVGETGYAPRVLIFNLDDTSSDIPLVSINEHSFGVAAVAWSADSRYMASLGAANDGFLYIWKIDPRTGAAKLFQQNRCTSYVRGMIWLESNSLVTFGVRHVKVWRIDESVSTSTSPTKARYGGIDGYASTPPPVYQSQKEQPLQQKTLPGRNILLGSMLEATFTSAAPLPGGGAVICSESGDICLLESVNKQMKLTRVRDTRFALNCVSVRNDRVYFGSKTGHSLTMDLEDMLQEGRRAAQLPSAPSTPSLSSSSPSLQSRMSFTVPSMRTGLVAMGFLTGHVVTVDTKQSIDIFSGTDHIPGEDPAPHVKRIPIPGHGEPILGIQALTLPNEADAAFFTWSSSGNILLWNVDGEIQSSLQVPIDQNATGDELEPANQLSAVRATRGGKLFVTADRCGVLRIVDFATKETVLETKAHASVCQSISIFEKGSKLLLATCGRDRTAQLFHRLQDGTVEHFQTLEFAAKAVQVLISPDDKVITCSFDRTLQLYDLVSKEDEPDVIAAIPARVITLKASPSSMALSPDARTVFVSLLDRTICQYDLTTSRLVSSFKCIDEGGSESALLDALIYGTQATGMPLAPPPSPLNIISTDTPFLLGLSNTDKSVRIYDANTGAFLDREWGHTEAINGVALIEEDEEKEMDSPTKSTAPSSFSSGCRKVVSVGSDGTIMFWSLDLREQLAPGSSISRDPSPHKDTISATASRPPLRKVLSKAELAEFQRPSTSSSVNGGSASASGKRSPSRSLSRRSSRYNLSTGAGPAARTPISVLLNNPANAIVEDTPSRRASAGSASGSPPVPTSPKTKVRRRPSLPAMSSTNTTPTNISSGSGATIRKKSSANNIRSSYGFGSLNMATEQTCRQLRAYRKRLASTDPIAQDVLVELDQELRLTFAALGDRATRSKAMSEELDGLLDEKLERLVSLLDKKWNLRQPKRDRERERDLDRPVLHRHRQHDRGNSGESATSNSSADDQGRDQDTDRAGRDDRSSNNSADMDNTSPDENSRPTSMAGSMRI
ncbi:WD domain, G-beta repeat containing protein [Sporothrix schenckii 1099-18]|uniref:WD domain, G-beta repeat containing protein n=1 Tax=Sporothrix schenckii 1099-18 TaxID=1397361 RepID=A0A0F2MFW2_SPOSC|nr:WD domain, G-beta repeat containing protein [Sporothrix schenckii 1099-18]KJR87051.1 WD domain, G-beta repeat containing protein [Sporothrix schenckii 1099-18]